ncbi:MAG: hypothetical protein LBP39_01305, partial [Rickettsiales bacterium]|nr:hypothetical protein [Rickettsiales bacterium]
MEDKNNKTLDHSGPRKRSTGDKWVQIEHRDGTSTLFKGELEDGIPAKGDMKYKDRVFSGTFDKKGKLLKGILTGPNGTLIEYKPGEPPYGETKYSGYTFKGTFSKDGKPLKGILTNTRGDVFDGEVDERGEPSKGTMTYADGTVYKGFWKNYSPYNVNETMNNQTLAGNTLVDRNLLDKTIVMFDYRPTMASVKTGLSNTGKSHCLFFRGRDNYTTKVEYHLFGHDKVSIDYGLINRILSEDSSKINSLNDLIDKNFNNPADGKVIEGVKDFNELKEFSKKVIQDRMSEGVENGLMVGAHEPLVNLLLLSSIDTVEQLKKIRFQLHYTREGEHSLKKEYKSLKGFLG